ncbi:MAG TPA: ester cyclase [Anaerolineae bacterium]|nr:ester cyclase [Anaerolineae bacterium]
MSMSTGNRHEALARYLESEEPDASLLAPDVAFTVMATGDTYRGPEGVRQMLDYFYQDAFDARSEARNVILDGDHAVWEGHFVGEHTGEFVGLPATGKKVCVPLVVLYDLKDGLIHKGRVYLELPVLLQQIGVGQGV